MKRVMCAAAIALALAVTFRSAPVESHSVSNTTVSFDREISRIIKKRCISCHSDQNLGVPLTAYEEVRPWTGSIREEILRRHLPPPGSDTAVFLCGPPMMADALEHTLKDIGYAEQSIILP